MRPIEQVNFIVGGVQKGGTTALFDHMQRDMLVNLSCVKEAHFFDDDALDWVRPDYVSYHALFAQPHSAPWGEATPIYLYWPNCLERIAAYNPRIRLIFIFRDPVERAWSHWRMEKARGFDDASFSWAIREGRARVLDDPDTPGFHRVYSYVERGFYGAQLAHALSVFPREQLLLLRSDDLKRNPSEVLSEVARHIGVAAPTGPIEPLQSHVSMERGGAVLQEEDRVYLRAVYTEDAARFTELSGLDLSPPEGG